MCDYTHDQPPKSCPIFFFFFFFPKSNLLICKALTPTCYLKILTYLAKNALIKARVYGHHTTSPLSDLHFSISKGNRQRPERHIRHVNNQHFTVSVVEYMVNLTEIGVLRFFINENSRLFIFMFSYSMFLTQKWTMMAGGIADSGNHISVCSLWIACKPMQYFVRTVQSLLLLFRLGHILGYEVDQITELNQMLSQRISLVFISTFLSKLPFSYLLLFMYLCVCCSMCLLWCPPFASNVQKYGGCSGLWLCTERSKLNCFLQTFFCDFLLY